MQIFFINPDSLRKTMTIQTKPIILMNWSFADKMFTKYKKLTVTCYNKLYVHKKNNKEKEKKSEKKP